MSRLQAPSSAHPLVVRWREEAALFRRRGQVPLADLMESVATDLEQYLTEHALETLTVAQAATESGYSASQLRRMVQSGELENAGASNSVRLRRGDLPWRRPTPPGAGPDLVGRLGRRGSSPSSMG